ncbi:hypothetical protein cyc_08037 [Cyclospora cayetanensis]|uniref:Uncharacterized protein n=1 Tax=Cyclospora cayetanensis TaxID=88456 RepID=A0A1D3CYF8_9EIME|nr:hypothetical protein cyc_08037 [Cyclospora cayetanensis]
MRTSLVETRKLQVHHLLLSLQHEQRQQKSADDGSTSDSAMSVSDGELSIESGEDTAPKSRNSTNGLSGSSHGKTPPSGREGSLCVFASLQTNGRDGLQYGRVRAAVKGTPFLQQLLQGTSTSTSTSSKSDGSSDICEALPAGGVIVRLRRQQWQPGSLRQLLRKRKHSAAKETEVSADVLPLSAASAQKQSGKQHQKQQLQQQEYSWILPSGYSLDYIRCPRKQQQQQDLQVQQQLHRKYKKSDEQQMRRELLQLQQQVQQVQSELEAAAANCRRHQGTATEGHRVHEHYQQQHAQLQEQKRQLQQQQKLLERMLPTKKTNKLSKIF